MRKIHTLLVFIFLISSVAFSQYRWDYGLRLGVSNYLGDIGGTDLTRRNFVSDMKLAETKFSGGIFVRTRLGESFGLKASLNYGRIAGADSLSTNYGRRGRNLSFRNDIFELAVTGEYYFYQVNDLGHTYRYRNDFKAYIFAGIAGFHHNPEAYYGGTWVDLQPLKTEGQKTPYSLWQASIPVGAGVYFTLNRKFRIGWELGWRTTFTDYLDDISTKYPTTPFTGSNAALASALSNRSGSYIVNDPVYLAQYGPGQKRGDPTHNDSYIFTTIDFSYVIRGQSNFYHSHYSSLFGGKKYRKRKIRAKF
ncbi:MAG: DUF6089 family protein [Bacteroidia bacterium]